jgi:Ubiquitin-activating enzyme active site
MDVGDASSELSQLLDELAAMDLIKLQLEPAGFEKDQDLNFHIDFVASARYFNCQSATCLGRFNVCTCTS